MHHASTKDYGSVLLLSLESYHNRACANFESQPILGTRPTAYQPKRVGLHYFGPQSSILYVCACTLCSGLAVQKLSLVPRVHVYLQGKSRLEDKFNLKFKFASLRMTG